MAKSQRRKKRPSDSSLKTLIASLIILLDERGQLDSSARQLASRSSGSAPPWSLALLWGLPSFFLPLLLVCEAAGRFLTRSAKCFRRRGGSDGFFVFYKFCCNFCRSGSWLTRSRSKIFLFDLTRLVCNLDIRRRRCRTVGRYGELLDRTLEHSSWRQRMHSTKNKCSCDARDCWGLELWWFKSYNKKGCENIFKFCVHT